MQSKAAAGPSPEDLEAAMKDPAVRNFAFGIAAEHRLSWLKSPLGSHHRALADQASNKCCAARCGRGSRRCRRQ